MRALLLRLVPARWREALDGDLQEAARRRGIAGLFASVWIIGHVIWIALRLRTADATATLDVADRTRLLRWCREAAQDVRYGARRSAKRPLFTLAAVATIALGIGSTSALFSVVDGVLLKPLPYPNADRLVTINRTYPDWLKDPVRAASWDRISLAWPEFFQLRDGTRTIEALGVITHRLAIVDGAGAQEMRVAVTSASFLPLVGATPTLGSLFSADADTHDPGTMLISHDVWTGRYGADPAIVGRVVPVRGGSRTIAGVLPAGFTWGLRGLQPHFWYPLSAIPPTDRSPTNRNLDSIARLRRGVTAAEAADELSAALRERFPVQAATGAAVTPLMARQLRAVRTPLLVLLAGAVLLLLIACANVAALLTGDAAGRDTEMAVRASLGATGFRLLRQLLTEGLLLALTGSALGLLLAMWGVRLLIRLAPLDMPRVSEIAVDWRVALVALVGASTTALLFAALPALALRRTGGTPGTTTARTVTRRRAAATLTVVEIALGVALLSGAGLFVRSLERLQQVDAGFDRSRLLTFRAGNPPSPTLDDAKTTRFFEEAREAIRALPGVTSVAVSSNLVLVDARASTSLSVTHPVTGAVQPFQAQRRTVSPEYFRTLGIRTLSGRTFVETDTTRSAPVAVVSRDMQRRLWPDGAVGRTFTYARSEHSVVGVVNDLREQGLASVPVATFYLSTTQRPAWPIMHLVVKTTGDPATLSGAIRQALARVDPTVPVEDIATMDAIVFRATDDERYRAALMSLFAIAAAVLAGVGLYTTVARRVVDRRREIGVRIALGARPAQVRRLFLGEGLRLAAAGIVAGVPLALAVGRAASTLLFGISPADAATLIAVVCGVGALALVAAYVPSVRASRLDPVVVLRSD